MSRPINLTKEMMEDAMNDFAGSLPKVKLLDGKLSFQKSFVSKDDKTTLWFTPIAWLKMQYLVHKFDSEVGWHGTAERVDDGYVITDILLYPQEVTGTTVEMNMEKYPAWKDTLSDAQFNSLRMHGHSHVNMRTTPSSVDIDHQRKILEQLEQDMFYVFLIWNKKGEKNVKIYDLAQNILYENGDVTVKIISSESFGTFMSDVKNMVSKKPAVVTTNPYFNLGRGSFSATKNNSVPTQTTSFTDEDLDLIGCGIY